MRLQDILKIKRRGDADVLHLAVSIGRLQEWAEKNRMPLKSALEKNVAKMKMLMALQQKKGIPILTMCIPQPGPEHRQALTDFFTSLAVSEEIHKTQTRIFIIGKWYELEQDLIDAIKQAMSRTAAYDQYFLNVCINYDGQEELLSAIRIIARRVFAEKIEVEDIDYGEVKDNLYSSYFTPPDLVIETDKTYSGMLLWDLPRAFIHFLDGYWLDQEKEDVEDILKQFARRTGKTVS